MAVDIKKLDVAELAELQAQIQTEMTRKKQEKKREVINQIKALLAENGMTMDDLPGRGGSSSTRPPVLPKYRNPKNPEQTWTGRGRKPRWVVEFLDKGGKMSKLEI